MAMSLNEQIEAVSRAIYTTLGPLEYNAYIDEVWPDHAILCLMAQGGQPERHYQIGYTIDAAGAVTLEDRAAWVEVEEVYQPVAASMLSYRGGAIKSLGPTEDGQGLKVGGYLVTFGSPEQTDLYGDFFTKDTDFDFVDGEKTAVYFNHRLPVKTRDGGFMVVKTKIGEGTLTKDDKGVLIDAILYEREQYESALAALGWSSGTADHLVETESIGGKTWIKAWPLKLDASITPRPAEPRNRAVPIKTLLPKAAPKGAGKASAPAAADNSLIIIL